MSALRAGVIGLGVGMQHAEGLAAHPDCILTALCDIDPTKRDEAASRFPEARLYDSAEALLDEADIDLLCVASYDDRHVGQILRALANGWHVFAEKPLTTRIEDTVAIREALRRQPRLHLSSNTILRLSPRFMNLRAEIEAGGLGRLFAIEGDYNYGRLWKLTEGWRGDIDNYSVILGGGVHIADLLLWLTGDRVREVHAIGNSIASAGSGFAGYDLVMALLRFESGIVGKLSANFGCVEPHFHRLLVYGTDATFENGRESALLWRSRDPADAPAILDTAYPGVPKHALIPSFIDEILGRGNAVVDEDDVFAAMALCHAIDRSVASGRPETVQVI